MNSDICGFFNFCEAKCGAKAKAQAIKAFISQAPLPKILLSFSVATKGFEDHPFDEAGTTSVWPDKIIPFSFEPLLPIVANKFALSFVSS